MSLFASSLHVKLMQPIEYIGPVPKKKKPKPKFGGWIIVLLCVAFIGHFALPFFEGIAHASQDQPSAKLADNITERLLNSHDTSQIIAGTAILRSEKEIIYDPTFYELTYPMGDIAEGKGTATDLVIRSLRAIGLDLQKEIHEDMSQSFHEYPQLWSLKEANHSIDHRRIENIRRYLERHHISEDTSRNSKDYRVGNIVFWRLPKGQLHLGIIVPGPGVHENEKWVVHNLHSSPKWEDILFDYNIVGNFSIRVYEN